MKTFQKPVIQTKNLKKFYKDKKSVDGISLDIGRGQIYGFLGPNGAGKSTTMKMLLGLAKPTEGEVTILGIPLDEKHKGEILKRTGSLIESPAYYGHLTAGENMELLEILLDLPKGRGEKALELVRLENVKDKKVSEFSLGMKQRLGIAMALVRDPEILILDEPVNGLDPAGIEEIRELLKYLSEEKNMTIMISSHLLDEIEKICDHIGIIQEGRMIFQGSMEELDRFRKPSLVIESPSPDTVLSLLKDHRPKIEDGRVVLSGFPRNKRAALLKFLVDRNVPVTGFYEEQRSLESLFLQLTEGGAIA